MSYSRFLGYEKGEDGEPQIVEEEAEVVCLIYQMYLDGASCAQIAEYLTDAGILRLVVRNDGGKVVFAVF